MLGIAALVSVPGVLGFASLAGAAPAGHFALTAGGVHSLTTPNSNIKGAGSKFKPKTLNATWTAKKEKACTDTSKFAFSITNKTSGTEQVTYESADFGSPIPAGGVLDVCADGTGTFTAVFGNTSSSSTLTVTVT
jgi:hypothetical protein